MNSEDDLLMRAQEYDKKHQFDLAVQCYKQAIALGTEDQTLAHQGLCRSLARLKRFDEAISEGQKWLELNPDLPIVRRTLGNIYSLQGDYSQSEKEFSLALILEPNNPINLKNLALVYGALGEYEKAIEPIKRLIQLCLDDLEAKLALADFYIQQKNYKTALVETNKILKAMPTFLRLYLIYAFVPIHLISKMFIEANLLAKIIVIILMLSIAAFTPPIISVPVGILLSVYFLLGLVVITNSKSKFRYILYILFLSTFLSGLYWFFVWLHNNIDIRSIPVLQRYIA